MLNKCFFTRRMNGCTKINIVWCFPITWILKRLKAGSENEVRIALQVL